jgi:hypothetical protein
MSSNPPKYSVLSGSEDQEPWQDVHPEGYAQAEEGEVDVHLATVSEKKRLWWKNSAINVLFMLSWSVSYMCLCS